MSSYLLPAAKLEAILQRPARARCQSCEKSLSFSRYAVRMREREA